MNTKQDIKPVNGDKNHPANFPPKHYENAATIFDDVEDWTKWLGDGEILVIRHTSEMSWVEHVKSKQFMDI